MKGLTLAQVLYINGVVDRKEKESEHGTRKHHTLIVCRRNSRYITPERLEKVTIQTQAFPTCSVEARSDKTATAEGVRMRGG